MRKKRWPFILAGIILLSLILAFFVAHYAVGMMDRAAPPEPETTRETGALYGYVTAAKARWLPGVPMLAGTTITLSPGGYTAESDSRGVYYVTDVPPATYTLTFAKEGFEDYHLENVRVMAGQALYLDGSLFPVPNGASVADLRLTTSMGIGSVPDVFPYHSTVYLDAGQSKNASREGFRWEVYDPEGNLVYDPYFPEYPLAPQVSEMPKASPSLFTFEPPGVGDYTVRLYLQNNKYSVESMAEVTITAVNVAPVASPRVFPGPLPPQKGGSVLPIMSSGAKTAAVGEPVYLRGYALDRNYPTPEHYNPAGIDANIYGLNHDHQQSIFSWRWRLELSTNGTSQDVTTWLQEEDGSTGTGTQHVSFVAAEPGVYRAYLTVLDNNPYEPLESEEGAVEIHVLPQGSAYVAEDALCEECHGPQGDYPASSIPFADTIHGQSGSATCESCHGPGRVHLEARGTNAKKETITVSYDAGTCGQCHEQFNEWEKSMHSDGYAFGFLEIAQPLLLTCNKCHYPQGFARTTSIMERDGVSFKEVTAMKPMFPAGPQFFDFSLLPQADGAGISCTVCHNAHGKSHSENPMALRLGSAEALCATCHEEKWHNVLLRGTAGETGSAYEYPTGEYNAANPHLSNHTCVLCHMDTAVETLDDQGIREVGGHTLRMRSMGDGDTLGGYGPRADNPSQFRLGEDAENVLNLAPCLSCHDEAETFNLANVQAENFALWLELGETLRLQNNQELPGYKPGDKCATCHRGGTLPFANDPELVLENAYSNYKLVGNDRSWGIHNPHYTRQLLKDALNSLQ